jgi:hypothetical protein
VAGGLGRAAGRRLGRGAGGVAQGFLDRHVLAHPGGTALHHPAQRVARGTGAAGSRPAGRPGGRAPVALPGLQDTVGQGDGGVAVMCFLLEDEAGDRAVVEQQRPRHGLAGEVDQVLALGGDRLGQHLPGLRDDGAEILARQHGGHQLRTPALGQGSDRGRDAAGEAVGEAQPVLRVWPAARTARRTQQHRQGERERGVGAGQEGEGHGRDIEEFYPGCKQGGRRGVDGSFVILG